MRTQAVVRITLLSLVAMTFQPMTGIAEPAPVTTKAGQNDFARDFAKDFEWEIGTWKTHLKRRLRPLTGSEEWAEYDGTTVVRKVWDGRANLVELEVAGPAGRIEGLSLRLYNPQSHQWTLNFSNSASGTLEVPAVGGFRNGRGEFYNPDTLGDRSILVRFIMSEITQHSARFEQAFSADGGKTWEVNWIATDTRTK